MQYLESEWGTVQELLHLLNCARSGTLDDLPGELQSAYHFFTSVYLDSAKDLVTRLGADHKPGPEQMAELRTALIEPMLVESRQALRKLPLYKHKAEILAAVSSHSVVVLKSSTGSGKTTQLPQYLAGRGVVVCSQPRKLAATNVGQRVRTEVGETATVNSVLHAEELPSQPRGLLFTTERALLNVLLDSIEKQKWLDWIDVLILDEAHERSIDCDVILGLVKESVLPRRPNFRLVVTSATVDVSKLQAFLPQAQVLEFLDSCYPVHVQYVSEYLSYFSATRQELDEVINDKLKEGCTDTVLVFLTGLDEILQMHDYFLRLYSEEAQAGRLLLQTLHGRLSYSEQSEIVNLPSSSSLRVIFSTNVAESSVTVSGVTTVIDCCRQKVRRYNNQRGVLEDKVVLISKDSATQRAGRCGRTGPGICIRIMTLPEFETLQPCREPMILQSHLGLIILKFTKYKLRNLADFPMQDNPPYQDVLKHLSELLALGALTAEEELEVAPLGHFILSLEIEPTYGKLLSGCAGHIEMLSLVSIVKNGSYVFERFDLPTLEEREVVQSVINDLLDSVFTVCGVPTIDSPQATLLKSLQSVYLQTNPLVEMGDVFLYLFVYRQFELVRCQKCYFGLQDQLESRGFYAVVQGENSCLECTVLRWQWCRQFDIVHSSMKFVRNAFQELCRSFHRLNVQLTDLLPREVLHAEALLALLATLTFVPVHPNCSNLVQSHAQNTYGLLTSLYAAYREHLREPIGRALCSVFPWKACMFRRVSGVETSFGLISLATRQVLLAHSSSPYVKQVGRLREVPQYFLYNDIVEQERLFIKTLTPIEWSWLQEQAGDWLEEVNFTPEYEDFAVETVQCIGPALFNYFTRSNLEGLEEQLHQEGAQMALLTLDFSTFDLRVWAPRVILSTAVTLVRQQVQRCIEEVIASSRYRQTFRKSAVLLEMRPGAIIESVSSLHTAEKYFLKGLKVTLNAYQLNRELSNLFTYKLAVLSRKVTSEGRQATVWFSSKADVDKAQQALRKNPLPGHCALITSLSLAGTTIADFAIKVYLPLSKTEDYIVRLLKTYGEVASYRAIQCQSCWKVIVWFTTTNHANHMLNNYRAIGETFGSQWSARITPMDEGIPVPKELFAMDEYSLNLEIQHLAAEFAIPMVLRGGTDNKHPKVFIKSNAGILPPELSERLVFLLGEDLVSAPPNVIEELLSRARFQGEGRELNFYEWKQWRKVQVQVHAGKATLSVVGLPLSRKKAMEELAAQLLHLSQGVTKRELSFASNTELRNFLNARCQEMRIINIRWTVNRRSNSVLLEGQKTTMDTLLSSTPPRVLQSRLQKACPLCYCGLTPETRVVLDLCGHQFHIPCVQEQIRAQLNEKPFPSLPLQCVECRQPLTQKDWYSVLAPEDVDALHMAALVCFVAKHEKFNWCQTPSCNYVYSLSEVKAHSVRKCPQCAMMWCLRCNRLVLSMAHEAQCEKGWEEETDRRNRLWMLEFTKACPRCRFRFEKSRGCNHIKCPKCAQDFCFICDAPLSSIPLEHYSVPGSLCFQKMMVDT